MNKIEITKRVINSVVAVGTAQIVRSIIKNNTNPESVTDQVAGYAGSFALGGMAANAASTHTDARIDAIVELYNKLFKKN